MCQCITACLPVPCCPYQQVNLCTGPAFSPAAPHPPLHSLQSAQGNVESDTYRAAFPILIQSLDITAANTVEHMDLENRAVNSTSPPYAIQHASVLSTVHKIVKNAPFIEGKDNSEEKEDVDHTLWQGLLDR